MGGAAGGMFDVSHSAKAAGWFNPLNPLAAYGYAYGITQLAHTYPDGYDKTDYGYSGPCKIADVATFDTLPLGQSLYTKVDYSKKIDADATKKAYSKFATFTMEEKDKHKKKECHYDGEEED